MPKYPEKLKASVKKNDGWWASIFAGPVANKFLEPICDLNFISPNLITLSSLALGTCAALCFSIGTHAALIVGAMLVQLSFIFDCMDGQLARYRDEYSNFGAWLDRVSDRVKDFLYFFALAYGHFSLNKYDWKIWPLAMLSIFIIFLIDYYVNQDIKLNVIEAPRLKKAANDKETILTMVLKLGLTVYRSIPILRFNIGEQALIISLFCFTGNVRALMLLIIILGGFYVFYWPIAKIYGYTETKVSSTEAAFAAS